LGIFLGRFVPIVIILQTLCKSNARTKKTLLASKWKKNTIAVVPKIEKAKIRII